MAIEIVDFPIENSGSFHSYVKLPEGIYILVGGIPTPMKNMKVSWDDDIPNMMGNIKAMFQTTNQHIYVVNIWDI